MCSKTAFLPKFINGTAYLPILYILMISFLTYDSIKLIFDFLKQGSFESLCQRLSMQFRITVCQGFFFFCQLDRNYHGVTS